MKLKKVLSLILAASMLTPAPSVFAAENMEVAENIEAVEIAETEVVDVDDILPEAIVENSSPAEQENHWEDSEETDSEEAASEDSDSEEDSSEEDSSEEAGFIDRSSIPYVSINTSFDVNDENYQIVMAGIPEEYVDDMLEFIKTNYGEDYDSLIYTNDELIDAEKWSNLVEGLDSNLCWAGSASNMLWNSGWAKLATNPLTGEAFTSEDEVFTYFSTRMTDFGSTQDAGIEWFFNALFETQSSISENPDAKLKETESASYPDLPFLDDSDGLLPDLLAQEIVEYVFTAGDLSCLSVLKDLTYDAEESKSVGLSVRFLKDGEFLDGGHALTALGVIFDALADTVESMYKSIILADSDDDAGYMPESLEEPELSEFTAEKMLRPNSYLVYPLQPYSYKGDLYWEIMNYDSSVKTLINGLVTLKNYSDELKESITETEGSTNIRQDTDLYLAELSMPDDTFEKGSDITVRFTVGNYSYFDLSSDFLPEIPYSCRLIRNGEVFLEFDDECDNQGINPFSVAPESLIFHLNHLTDTELPTGNYTFELTVNPYPENSSLQEAYYLNNTKSVSFIVTGTDDPEPTPEPTPVPGPEPLPQPEPNHNTPENPKIPQPHKNNAFSGTIPASLLRALQIANNGDWDLTKEDQNSFTVRVFHPVNDFIGLYEITKEGRNAEEKTGKIKIAEENYRIKDNKDGSFTIIFSKDYLNTLEEGQHTFAISLVSLMNKLTFDVEIKK